jgi:hypothetical protein
VSDVTPPDFAALVSSLADSSFFPPPPEGSEGESGKSVDHLKEMVIRWQSYLANGTFALAVEPNTPLGPMQGAGEDAKLISAATTRSGFWTQPWPYWDMQTHVPELWQELKEKSSLVIFKVSAVTYLHLSDLTSRNREIYSEFVFTTWGHVDRLRV